MCQISTFYLKPLKSYKALKRGTDILDDLDLDL